MTPLDGWGNFYVIVGSSAGALIGLQFVVLTLIATRPLVPGIAQAGDAFATPSVVHFAVVLLWSAMLSAPWQGMGVVSLLLGLLGVGGIGYEGIVTRRLKRQTAYQPVFEDWLFHVLLPVAAYAMVVASAFWAYSYSRRAMFVVAAAALVLLFTGIHNAWDAVTYHVFVHEAKSKEQGAKDEEQRAKS